MATDRAPQIADQTSKDIANGFCKTVQLILIKKHPDDAFYIIPQCIIDICLSYSLLTEREMSLIEMVDVLHQYRIEHNDTLPSIRYIMKLLHMGFPRAKQVLLWVAKKEGLSV